MLKNGSKSEKREHFLRNSVDEEAIASIVSRWTGIPVNKMMDSEKQKVLKVEEVLKQDVYWSRSELIKAISRAIKRNKAVSETSRPIGSFLFLRPTGGLKN